MNERILTNIWIYMLVNKNKDKNMTKNSYLLNYVSMNELLH